jgi:hypothetical protein
MDNSVMDKEKLNDTKSPDFIDRVKSVKDEMKANGIYNWKQFFKRIYPEYSGKMTRVGNVWAYRTKDFEILEKLERMVEKLKAE